MKKPTKKPAAQMPTLTIILQGPKGVGKTQFALLLQSMLLGLGVRNVKATDGGEDTGPSKPLTADAINRLRDTLEKRNIRIFTVQG